MRLIQLVQASLSSLSAARIVGSLTASFAGQGILVVSGVLAARVLGVEGRGQLALIVLVPGILAQLGSLGMPFALTYYIARNPSRGKDVVRAMAPIAALQAIALVIVHIVVLAVVVRGEPAAVRLAAVASLPAIPALLAMQFGVAILQGQQRFLRLNTVRSLPGAVYALAVLAIFVGGSDALGLVVIAWVASSVLGAFVLLGAALRSSAGSPPAGPMPTCREVLAFGLRGHLGSLSLLETMPIDQAVVGVLCGPAALGLYVVALAFTNLPRFIGQSVGLVAYPHLANKTDVNTSRKALWRFTAVATVPCVFVVGVMAVSAGVAVPVLFGREFQDSAGLLLLLLPGALFYGIRRTLAAGVSGMGRAGLTSASEVFSWPVFLLILAILGPGDQGEGVAIAMSVAAAVSLGYLLVTMSAFPQRAARQWQAWRGRREQRRNARLRPGLTLKYTPWLGLAAAAGIGGAWLPTWITVIVVVTLGAALLLIPAFRMLRPTGSPLGTVNSAQADGLAEVDDLRVARFFFYLGLLFLGQLVIRPVLATTLSDWLFLVSLGLTLLAPSTGRHLSAGVPRLLVVGVALFAIGALLAASAAVQPATSLLITAKFVYLTLGWFWLSLRLLRTDMHVRHAVRLWTLSIAVSGGAAIVQYVAGDVIPGTSPAWGRMTGTGDNVNDLGGMAAIALLPALAIVRGNLRAILPVAISVLILAGLLLSGAVAGMMAATTAGVVWFGLTGIRPKSALIIAALVVAGLVVFQIQGAQQAASTPLERFQRVTGPQDDPNATLWSRVDTYKLALRRFETHPVVGSGLDPVSSTLPSGFETHNVLLGPLSEAGIFGGVGMALVLFAVAKTGRSAMNHAAPEYRPMVVASFASFVAFVAFAMTAPVIYQRYGWVSAAMLLACCAQAYRDPVPVAAKNETQARVLSSRSLPTGTAVARSHLT